MLEGERADRHRIGVMFVAGVGCHHLRDRGLQVRARDDRPGSGLRHRSPLPVPLHPVSLLSVLPMPSAGRERVPGGGASPDRAPVGDGEPTGYAVGHRVPGQNVVRRHWASTGQRAHTACAAASPGVGRQGRSDSTSGNISSGSAAQAGPGAGAAVLRAGVIVVMGRSWKSSQSDRGERPRSRRSSSSAWTAFGARTRPGEPSRPAPRPSGSDTTIIR